MKKSYLVLNLCLLSLGVIHAMNVQRNIHECYANNSDPYLLFATKTSYFTVDNEETTPIQIEGCKAKSFWLLARHATRNPGDDDIAQMEIRGPEIQAAILDNHQNGKGDLCEADYKALSQWAFELTIDDDSLITDSGKSEMKQLGQRYKARLPDLLSEYVDEDFNFRTTNKQRTIESAKSFGEGAFPDHDVDIPPPLDDEPLLRFFEFCPKWSNGVDNNEATYNEMNLFKDTQTAKDALARINAKLGFTVPELEEEITEVPILPDDDLDEEMLNMTETTNKTVEKREAADGQVLDELTFEDALLMFDLCRYEQSRNPEETSVWCAAFTDEDLQIMEYHEELKYWHKNGYFYEINTQFACPLMENLVTTFEGELSDQDYQNMTETNGTNVEYEDETDYVAPKGTFYFSHSEAVLPFLSLLGINKDDYPLTHDNFEEVRQRKYRTSKMAPFAANIGFLMMECEQAPMKRVMTFLQEQAIQLPKCDDLACDWQTFKDIYRDDISCPFEEICAEDGTPLRRTSLESNGFGIMGNVALIVLSVLYNVA